MSLLFGDSLTRAVGMALVVGVGTLGFLFAWHYLRAPKAMNLQRARLLNAWRGHYEARYAPYPKAEPAVVLTAETGSQLAGAWRRIEHESGLTVEARTTPWLGPGLELPGNRALLEWPFPSSFPGAVVRPGRYEAMLFIGDHPEPAATVGWELA